jgi:uncharacterized repeat protein (TIGR03803 family)
MLNRRPLVLFVTVFAATLLLTNAWATSQEKVPHNFKNNGEDGYYPASVIFDSAGNIYGTTQYGGAHAYGTVFELMPKAGGGWTEKILHNFNGNGRDGYYPSANLILDAAGNLYGTTVYGGAYDLGTVFELMPKAGSGWTEKIVHNFNDNGKDGYYPRAALIFDAGGNLYGTTSDGGGKGSYGSVFELTPKKGAWTEDILHSFRPASGDGDHPSAALIFDAAGNLYSTTLDGGGTSSYGTVFKLTHQTGSWTEKILHSFYRDGSDDGSGPGGLIFDGDGNLYGVTSLGGSGTCVVEGEISGCGVVFKLTPAGEETILYNFQNNGKDGQYPTGGLIFNPAGSLYGTTQYGGTGACQLEGFVGCGTVFELTPEWTETVIWSFNSKDGFGPQSPLVLDAAGDLYGATGLGGTSGTACGGDGCGTAFEITP